MIDLEKQSVPVLTYDGGSIVVPMGCHDEVVTKHTGWIIQHQYDDTSNDDSNPVIRDRKTILGFGTCIQSIEYRDRVDVLHKEISAETNVRWCWRTKDIHATKIYFQQEGAKVSELYNGPGNTNILMCGRQVRTFSLRCKRMSISEKMIRVLFHHGHVSVFKIYSRQRVGMKQTSA